MDHTWGSQSPKVDHGDKGSQAPPAASFLNAFERSFASFLHNKSDGNQEATNDLDPNSSAGISAIISSTSSSVQLQNPIDSECQRKPRKQIKNGKKVGQNQNHVKENLPHNDQFPGNKRPKTMTKSKLSKSILSPALSLTTSGESAAEQRRRELKILEEEREKNEAVNNLLGLVNDDTNNGMDDSLIGTFIEEEVDETVVEVTKNSDSVPVVENNSGTNLTSENVMNKKSKIDTEQRRFQCNSCPKSFKSNSHLKEHEMIHSGVFPYNCDQCKKGFRRENALQSHKCLNNPSSSSINTSSETKSPKTFRCDECNKIYTTKQGFQIHKCNKNESSSRNVSKKKETYVEEEEFIENVQIEVPVIVASSEIQFLHDGSAVIFGDILNYDLDDDITVEDACNDGWIVETVEDDEICIGEEDKVNEFESLPCVIETLATDTGVKFEDLCQLFEFLATKIDDNKGKCLLPWQDQPGKKGDGGNETLLIESKDLIHQGLKPLSSSTLEELPSLTKEKSIESKVDRRVSLNNFTYFNDKAAAVFEGSGDDTDDEDWSETIKCRLCKKEFSSKLQLKKHSKIHSSSGWLEKKPSKNNRNNLSLNSSILLQSDDDMAPTSKSSRKSEKSMILFSTLN